MHSQIWFGAGKPCCIERGGRENSLAWPSTRRTIVRHCIRDRTKQKNIDTEARLYAYLGVGDSEEWDAGRAVGGGHRA